MNPRGISEDWLSVWIGLLVFALALAVLGGADILGWVVTTAVWTDLSRALAPVSKNYAGLGGTGALIATYVAGLVVGNFFPGFARWMKEAVRPEWYIKTAIVILGGFLGVTAAAQPILAKSVMFRGLAAIMVASLVVVFAVVELLILPFAANAFLAREPMVAGAWMGLAVKTDGAAVASGAITESLILAGAAAEGVNYAKGWILGATTMVKVFIDIFIGIWAFI